MIYIADYSTFVYCAFDKHQICKQLMCIYQVMAQYVKHQNYLTDTIFKLKNKQNWYSEEEKDIRKLPNMRCLYFKSADKSKS